MVLGGGAVYYERGTTVRRRFGKGRQVGSERVNIIQGYLAHKEQRPPRTLPQEYAQGPMVVLGGGGLFLMSEVHLYRRP